MGSREGTIMNIIEVTYEQAKMDIEEFFNSNIERSPMSVAFFTLGVGLIVLRLLLKSGGSL